MNPLFKKLSADPITGQGTVAKLTSKTSVILLGGKSYSFFFW